MKGETLNPVTQTDNSPKMGRSLEREDKLRHIDGELRELSGGSWINPIERSRLLESGLSPVFDGRRRTVFIPKSEITRMQNDLISISKGDVWEEWKDKVADMKRITEGESQPFIQQIPRVIGVCETFKAAGEPFTDDTHNFSLRTIADIWNRRQEDRSLPAINKYDAYNKDDSSEDFGVLRAFARGPLKGTKDMDYYEQRRLQKNLMRDVDGRVSDNYLYALMFEYLRNGNDQLPEPICLNQLTFNYLFHTPVVVAGFGEKQFQKAEPKLLGPGAYSLEDKAVYDCVQTKGSHEDRHIFSFSFGYYPDPGMGASIGTDGDVFVKSQSKDIERR